MEIEFKSCVNPHEKHKFSEGGFKKTVDVYEELIDPRTGKLEVKKTKEEPFYEKIQEMKDSQILENIIQRYNIDLNENHITEISEELVDMTQMPRDLIETFALTKKLESLFNESTAEIKNHFKDFAGFLKSFQNGKLRSELQQLSTRHQANQVNQSSQVEQTTQVENQVNQQQNQAQGGIIYG